MTSFVPVLTSSGSLFVPDAVAPPAPEQEFALPAEWVEQVWLRLRENVECLDADDTIRALTVATAFAGTGGRAGSPCAGEAA